MEKLCTSREVSWTVSKKGVSVNYFTAEVRICLHIIYSWVSPCTNMTTVPNMSSWMISCILDNIPLNVCQVVILIMMFFKTHDSMHLLFTSFITKLCKRAMVKVYLGDTWVHQNTLIYPLKIWCKEALVKNTNKKIDLSKSIFEDTESCIPSIAAPFDDITVDLR